ncbi:hypothetical protein EJB05_30667, partial [Eragrostis curvula]
MARGLPSVSHHAKMSWPELVGRSAWAAIVVIKGQRQDVLIKLLGAGDQKPGDFDAHRVCLFIDDEGNVAKTAVVG